MLFAAVLALAATCSVVTSTRIDTSCPWDQAKDASFAADGTVQFAHNNGHGVDQSCQRVEIEPEDLAECIPFQTSDAGRWPSGIYLPLPTKGGLCTECWFFQNDKCTDYYLYTQRNLDEKELVNSGQPFNSFMCQKYTCNGHPDLYTSLPPDAKAKAHATANA